MNIRDFILGLFGYRRAEEHTYQVSADVHAELVNLAEIEQRPVEEMHDELLARGLVQKYSESELLRRWHSLTLRERDVTVLTCRGYTNSQIAVKLGVSPETVKVHVAKALSKFGVHGKAELRNLLEVWNFSEWE